MRIPFNCIICPPNCLRSPSDPLGICLQELWETGGLRGDALLTFLISREVILDESSVFEPYIYFLRLIEEPETIEVWNDEELEELKDPIIFNKARLRLNEEEGLWNRVCAVIKTHSPELDITGLTLELHTWSWRILQSRAFGRRLPWTSLVPLADCLNHSNLNVRYKLEKNGEIINPHEKYTFDPLSGDFVMYPSGGNFYREGEEVFNSYGRRSNSHLMLDYGFCIQNNEWETVQFTQRLHHPDEPDKLYKKIKNVLNRAGLNGVRNLKLGQEGEFGKGLMFYRIVNLTLEEVSRALVRYSARPRW